MKLSAKVDDVNVNILLLNETIFVELGNVYVKFALENVTTVESFLYNNFGIDLPVSEIIEKIEEIQSSELPLENLAALGLTIDLTKIDLAFFDNIVVDGDITTINLENIGEVKITLNNKVLSKIEFVGNGVDADVDFVEFNEFSLAASEENYIDVIDFLPTIENSIDIVNSNTISGVIDVTFDQTTLSINYTVDKKDLNDIYATFSTNLLGADICGIYTDNKIFVNVADSFKLAVNVTSLPEAIKEFLTAINVELASDEETINMVVGMIVGLVYDENTPLLITSLTQTENGLEIEVFNGLNISIVNGSTKLTLAGTYDNISVSATLIGGDINIERETIDETQYNQFESVLDLAEKVINSGLLNVAEGAYNYFKNGLTLGLTFNATYNNIALSGRVDFNLEAKEIRVSVNYDGISFNVIVVDKIAYLEIGNIYAKYSVDDLGKIETLIKNHFGLDIPLSKVVELFNETSSNEEPLAKLSSLGSINISEIDLAFFDNIIVDGDITTIAVENVGNINITVIDKLLTSVSFEGNDISASANFVDFAQIELAVSKESYIDLSKLLPTIENAITIANSPYINGVININESIAVNFAVNKADTSNVYAQFTTTIQGANIKVMYLGGKVYIHFADSIKLVSDFATLPSTINRLLEKADIAFNISENVDAGSMLSSILSVINPENTQILITSLVQGENNSLTITLHNQTSITLNNLSQEINFSTSVDNTGVNGVIIGSETIVEIPTIDDNQYIPLEDVLDLVEAFLNMAKLKDFHISGSLDIVGTIAGINLSWNVPYDLRIKEVDGEIQAMFVMGEIPVVVGLNNDVPMIAGDTDGGYDRYLKIFIKGRDVYIYRTEYVTRMFGMAARHYEKCTKITMETFLADPLRYVQYTIGFSDTIMNAISDAILKSLNRENPINLNNVVKSLAIINDTSFKIVLNAAELANNSDLGDLTLDIGIGHDGNGDSYLTNLGLNVNMPLASIFELNVTTTDTVIVDYGSPVDMSEFDNYVDNYRYAYDAEWEASDGSWTKANEVLYTIYFEENGGNSVSDITAAYGTEIKLPSFTTTQSDDGTKQTTREFVGWYTSSTFEEGSEFASTTMPKGDTTLYAKWKETVRYYRTISFVTNSSDSIDPIRALERSNINLPALSLKEEATETSVTIYSFDGWFTDAELTNPYTSYSMPSEDIILYAKWIVADVEEANLLQLYDNGQLIYSRYILPGKIIDLSGVGKVNETTKFYLAENYTTLYEGEFIMPEENLVLHIRNMYSLTVYSQYGTFIDSTTSVWQGTALAIPSQTTVVDDDFKTRQITYTFNGYKIDGTYGTVPAFMPNSDIEVVADWTVTEKKYYTVSFDVTWVKPQEWNDANSSLWGKITLVSAPTPVAPQLVLEGTNYDPSGFTSTAVYKYKAAGIFELSYKFKILTWNTGGPRSITNGASNSKYTPLTSVPITGNTTLYGSWGVY